MRPGLIVVALLLGLVVAGWLWTLVEPPAAPAGGSGDAVAGSPDAAADVDADVDAADGTGADLQPFQRDAPAVVDEDAAAPADALPTGRLVGRVLLGREALQPEPIDRSADPALADADPIWDESMLVGPETSMQGVVVWPVQPVGEPLRGGEPVELTLRDGRFVPRLVVVAPGQTVRLVNADPTTYRLQAQPQVELSLSGKPNAGFVIDLGPGESVERRFGEPEVAVPIVGSYPHDWVVGWVAVLDRPYGLTDAFGRYELELPVGPHDVKLWHETMDTREGQVNVRADEEVDWSVTFLQGRGRR